MRFPPAQHLRCPAISRALICAIPRYGAWASLGEHNREPLGDRLAQPEHQRCDRYRRLVSSSTKINTSFPAIKVNSAIEQQLIIDYQPAQIPAAFYQRDDSKMKKYDKIAPHTHIMGQNKWQIQNIIFTTQISIFPKSKPIMHDICPILVDFSPFWGDLRQI